MISKKYGKKNSKLVINISTEQKKELTSIAENLGLSTNAYCLFVITSFKPKLLMEAIEK